MTTVTDINILLPILVADHAFHPTAWDWWKRQANASVGLCLLSRLGTLRLLTNTKVMAGHPVSQRQALSAWDLLASDPRTVWIEPGDSHEAAFRRFTADRQNFPNLWSDAWLAALAVSGNYRLTSFDADLIFRHSNWKLPPIHQKSHPITSIPIHFNRQMRAAK